MIVFVNSEGSIVKQTVESINQGSVEANKITLVCPFPSALVTIAFTLPNGIVLDTKVAKTASAMTDLGEAYEGVYVYTYTMEKALTTVPGTLGVQFFINLLQEGTEHYITIATPSCNVTINKGARFIPGASGTVTSSTVEGIIAAASASQASASEAELHAKDAYDKAEAAADSAFRAEEATKDVVRLNPDVETQEINSNIKTKDIKATNVDVGSGDVKASQVTANRAIVNDVDATTVIAQEVYSDRVVVRKEYSIGNGYDETIELDPVDGWVRAMNANFSESLSVGGVDVATESYVDGLIGNVAEILDKLNNGGAL